MFPFGLFYHKKSAVIYDAEMVYLNKYNYFSYGDPKVAIHPLVIGSTGTGKTITVELIGCQYPACFYFDTKGGAVDGLVFLNEKKNWVFRSIKKYWSQNDYPKFKMNARDLTPRIMDVFSAQVSEHTQKQRKDLNALFNSFFRLKPAFRKYKKLKTLFSEYSSLFTIWEDIKILFHQQDKAYDLTFWFDKKVLFDVVGLDSRSKLLPLLIFSVMDKRRDIQKSIHKKARSQIDRKALEKKYLPHLLIVVEDVQTYATSSTALGWLLGIIFSEGRQFLVSGCGVGTGSGDLNKHVKSNKTFYFYFLKPEEVAQARLNEGLNFSVNELEAMRIMYGKKGVAYIMFDELFIPLSLVHIEPYFWKELRAKQQEPETIKLDYLKEYKSKL